MANTSVGTGFTYQLKSNWGVNLTTRLYLVPKFRISEALFVPPYLPTWHALVKLYLLLWYILEQQFPYLNDMGFLWF